MRAVLTRVNSASVTIDGEVVGKIGKGFLILLGVGPNDTEKECRYRQGDKGRAQRDQCAAKQPSPKAGKRVAQCRAFCA